MKKKIYGLGIALGLLVVSGLRAASTYYNSMANETGLPYTKTYVLDLNANNIDRLSAQVTLTSVTVPTVTFFDGSKSTGTITISSWSALVEARSIGSVTIVSTTGLNGASAFNTLSIASNAGIVTLGTNAVVTLNGIPFREGKDWTVADTSTGTATALATMFGQIGFELTATTGSGGTGSTVTLTATAIGTAYNSYTLATSSFSSISTGSFQFINGANPASLKINNTSLIIGGNWAIGNTTTDTSKSLYNAATSYVDITSVLGTTWTSGSSVIFTAISTGSQYVYPMFTSTQALLSLSGLPTGTTSSAASAITGGRDLQYLQINGVTLVQGKQWFAVASNTGTAISISSAVLWNTTANLTGIVGSTWVASGANGVVILTSTFKGAFTKFSFYSSSQAAASLSGPVSTPTAGTSSGFLQGGTNPQYSTATAILSIPNHGIPNGMPVIYSTSSGVNITNLTWETTFYAQVIDTGSLRLAFTSTGAISGSSIAAVAPASVSTAVVSNNFTIRPLVTLGNTTVQFLVSNDSVSWFNTAISSPMVILNPAVSQSTSVYIDMGVQHERYIQATVRTSTGATRVDLKMNGKQ